jgi:hypothetical protein
MCLAESVEYGELCACFIGKLNYYRLSFIQKRLFHFYSNLGVFVDASFIGLAYR